MYALVGAFDEDMVIHKRVVENDFSSDIMDVNI